jgi:ParB family transcriptional regulator, chromosome partitioning protein
MASNKAPPRLGRGLAVLLGDTALGHNVERGVAVNAIPVDQIDPNPFQPRTDFDHEELESLSESIRAQGLLQPILIRPHPTAPDRYQIVAGERRFRAALLAGLTEIPSILREADDSDAAIVALVENLQRQDLNAIEEAEGYQRLLQEFGLTHEALGHAVSKSRGHIGNTIRLLRLPDPIQQEVRLGSLSSGHARALVNYPNPGDLVDQILAQGMSVRQTEMLVAKKIAAKGVVARQPPPEKLDVAEMERRVSDVLGSRVSITTNRKGGGELSIHFGNLYQLEELVDRLIGDRGKTSLALQE